jgi:hypothetical protein
VVTIWHLLQQSASLYFVSVCFSRGIISLNALNQVTFITEKYSVFFEVRTKFLKCNLDELCLQGMNKYWSLFLHLSCDIKCDMKIQMMNCSRLAGYGWECFLHHYIKYIAGAKKKRYKLCMLTKRKTVFGNFSQSRLTSVLNNMQILSYNIDTNFMANTL